MPVTVPHVTAGSGRVRWTGAASRGGAGRVHARGPAFGPHCGLADRKPALRGWGQRSAEGGTRLCQTRRPARPRPRVAALLAVATWGVPVSAPLRPLREEGSWCRWSFCPGSCFWSPLNTSTRRSQQHGQSYMFARGDCGRSTASAEGAGLLVCVSS